MTRVPLLGRRPDQASADSSEFSQLNRTAVGAATWSFGNTIVVRLVTLVSGIVLARILARVELRAVPGYQARVVRRGIAFAPSEGMPVVVERRAA